jgi:hypothetical protein
MSKSLWTDSDVEERWGQKPGYMSDQRKKGQGPRFLRLSARCVRYRPEDVNAFEAQQEFSNSAASMASDFRAPASSSEDSAHAIETPRKRFSEKKAAENAGRRPNRTHPRKTE